MRRTGNWHGSEAWSRNVFDCLPSYPEYRGHSRCDLLSDAFGLEPSSLKHRHPFPLRGEVDNRISPPLFAVFYTIDGFPHLPQAERIHDGELLALSYVIEDHISRDPLDGSRFLLSMTSHLAFRCPLRDPYQYATCIFHHYIHFTAMRQA